MVAKTSTIRTHLRAKKARAETKKTTRTLAAARPKTELPCQCPASVGKLPVAVSVVASSPRNFHAKDDVCLGPYICCKVPVVSCIQNQEHVSPPSSNLGTRHS